jgi:hypothetical protein
MKRVHGQDQISELTMKYDAVIGWSKLHFQHAQFNPNMTSKPKQIKTKELLL